MGRLSVLIILLLAISGTISCGKQDSASPTATDSVAVAAIVVPDTTVHRIAVHPLPGRLKSLFNDSNHVQLSAARAMGFQPIRSLRDARRLSRPLVKVESCPYYVVDSLSSSVPYLIPRAASLLADIGREFADSVRARGGHEYRIRVTSLTRTNFSVKRLRRRNINATEQSCHLFGTTFDISWVKFQNLDPDFIVSLEDLKNLLAEIIYNKRRQGLCYAKFEVKQGCFHITTR